MKQTIISTKKLRLFKKNIGNSQCNTPGCKIVTAMLKEIQRSGHNDDVKNYKDWTRHGEQSGALGGLDHSNWHEHAESGSK